ncbi:hypothetical protein, partial [Microbacterium hominis]|uniref:hypothetical protein n=1 Tax=Microbacterium hominis TaxID=162426 RepID=UPI000AF589F7
LEEALRVATASAGASATTLPSRPARPRVVLGPGVAIPSVEDERGMGLLVGALRETIDLLAAGDGTPRVPRPRGRRAPHRRAAPDPGRRRDA